MNKPYYVSAFRFSIAPQIFELLPIVPQKSAYWMEFWLVFYRVPVLLLNVREYLQDCTYFLCGYSNFSIPLCYLANTIVFDSVKSARNFLMGGFLKKTSWGWLRLNETNKKLGKIYFIWSVRTYTGFTFLLLPLQTTIS